MERKNRWKIGKNTTKGITLISLVVTIIILLILAGISIGMLSGDNGILRQAGNAKTQTDIVEEKEILEQATILAMGKSKYGDITKENLDNELNKYSEIESTEQTDKGIVVTFKSNRQYLVDSNGDVSSYSDIKIGNLVVKDGNTVLAENCKSVQLGKSLTISFDASIENGQITSITPNIAYTTAGERNKTFNIIGKTSEGKEITKEYTVNLKGYYNIPNLKVGDFVNYALKTPTSAELAQLNSDIGAYSGVRNNTEKTAVGETLLCRVLEIDENTGNPTKLISADGVNTLKLEDANGYNNAVYLINEMCRTLYSGNQGTTKSLTIEDLETNYFKSTALELAKGSNYEKKYRYTGSNSKYPLLATKEKRMGMNTATETVEGNTFNILNTSNTALDLSEQERSDLESGGGTTTNATNGITVSKTSYTFSAGDSKYKNAILNNIMHRSPTANGSDTTNITTYWLASRCIKCDTNGCYFVVRYVDSSCVNDYAYLTWSGGGYSSGNRGVRPIITLNSGIQAEYVEAYNDSYNIWSLN